MSRSHFGWLIRRRRLPSAAPPERRYGIDPGPSAVTQAMPLTTPVPTSRLSPTSDCGLRSSGSTGSSMKPTHCRRCRPVRFAISVACGPSGAVLGRPHRHPMRVFRSPGPRPICTGRSKLPLGLCLAPGGIDPAARPKRRTLTPNRQPRVLDSTRPPPARSTGALTRRKQSYHLHPGVAGHLGMPGWSPWRTTAGPPPRPCTRRPEPRGQRTQFLPWPTSGVPRPAAAHPS